MDITVSNFSQSNTRFWHFSYIFYPHCKKYSSFHVTLFCVCVILFRFFRQISYAAHQMTKPYFSHKKVHFFKKPHPLSLYISYLYILRLPTSDRGHQLFFGEPYRSKPNLLWNEQDVGYPTFIPTLQTHV